MKVLKRRIPFLLSAIFFFSLVFMPNTVEAKSVKAVRLDTKKITVSAGKSKRLKLLNNRKKTSWSIVSGRNYVQLQKKGKTGVTVVGKKAGKAVIRATVDKKKYTCNVTVKDAKEEGNSPSENPSKPEDNITPEEPTKPEEPVIPENPTVGDKTLIAYFSMIELVPEGADAATHATPAVGNTESVAMEIQKQTGGDLFAIKTVREYPTDHRECSKIASEELEKDARPELSTHVENMSDYKQFTSVFQYGYIGNQWQSAHSWKNTIFQERPSSHSVLQWQ